MTASTGMAAANIGGELLSSVHPSGRFSDLIMAGMTIHSWGAVAPDVFDVEQQAKSIRDRKPAFDRWSTTKALVIDEGECSTT